jgi:diacylglycerol kinase family enzyme
MLRAGSTAPIGYIPAGSTNDFASSLKLSTNIMQAAQDILEGQPVPYDVGRFGDRYFSYVASFGAFTKSSYATPQSIKNALGHTAYVLEGISELSQIRKLHVRMELEEEVVEDDFLFGCISNSTSIGGVLTLDPRQVDMADGYLEIFLLRAPRNLTEISECIQALQSQRYNDCAMITFGSARNLRVIADENMPWTLDGEKFDGSSSIDVTNIHHAIHLMQRVNKDA